MFDFLPIDKLLLPLSDFMQQGGMVLWGLACVVALSWFFIVERLIYLFVMFPQQKQNWIHSWQTRAEHQSWFARSIKEGWLSEAHELLFANLNFIKLLVTICPMIGLLGTVTGMISVFDVMATKSTADPKLMASGISLATLPTMAGMVAALAGLFMHSRLLKKCQILENKLEKSLRSFS